MPLPASIIPICLSSSQPPYLDPPWGCLLLLLHCLDHALLRVEHRIRLIPLLVRDGLQGRGKVRATWRRGRLHPSGCVTVLQGLLPPRDTGREVQVWDSILLRRGQPHLPFRQQEQRPFSSPPPPRGTQAGRYGVVGFHP